jgi:AcrR family transcriptional regulator
MTESEKPAPRRRLAPAERRRVILEAATLEMAELGYERSSMRAIARRAGVTTPVLYDHFASKRALHIALIDHHADAIRAHQERNRDIPVGRPLARALFEDFFAWVEANPYGWRILFHDAPADPETAIALGRARHLATRQIASFLALAPDLHTHSEADRALTEEIAAHGVYGLINSLAAWWWEHQHTAPATLAEVAFEMTWNGLATMTGLARRSVREPYNE